MAVQRVWCRDEFCGRSELHLAHEGDFSDEIKQRARDLAPKSKSDKPPWKRSAPRALDHSIAKAVSRTYPKHLDAILRDVESDYGSGPTEAALYRAVQRHLAVLVERGHILKIHLGRKLYAYLRPGSPLVNDVDMMREQIENVILESTASA